MGAPSFFPMLSFGPEIQQAQLEDRDGEGMQGRPGAHSLSPLGTFQILSSLGGWHSRARARARAPGGLPGGLTGAKSSEGP